MEAWERALVRKYGMKEGEYAEMLARQGGVCALCGKRPGRTRLAVDHDHATGRIRGLLHPRCNRALGPFESSTDSLTRLWVYVYVTLLARGVDPSHNTTEATR